MLILFLIAEGIARLSYKFTKEGPTAIHLQIYENSENYGWQHKPGAIDYFGYGNPVPEIKINSLGFRDDEIAVEKPENTKRILFLGDSFTFGMGVSHENIYTEILQKLLNESGNGVNFEVLNMGHIGFSIDNEYLLLKEKGLNLNPDVVILEFFVGNDVTELRRHNWIYDAGENLIALEDTKHYVDEENRLRYKGSDEPWSYFFNFINTRVEIFKKKMGLERADEPTLTWPAFLDPNDPNGDPRVAEFWERIDWLFDKLKKELDDKGVKLVVVAIPMDVQTNKKYWNKYSTMYFDEEAYEKARPQAQLKQITDKYGIDLIDLLPYFKEADDSKWLYFEKLDPHFTIEGNEFAAEVIFNNLNL